MRRWAAVAIVRKRKLELADQLITLLLDVEEEVRREARLALTGLAHGKDLGPEEPSDQAARERAITQWTAWRREQVEKDAQNQLKLARQLESQGKKEPAQRRYEQVVRDFPASDAAREARRHLTP